MWSLWATLERMAWYIDVIIESLIKEFRLRYKHLALGYIWSIASPLAYAMIYYFVFAVILQVKTPHFAAFLITGLFPWQWLNNSISVGPMTFYGNASLIKKTTFPRYIIPLVVVLQDGIHFLISLPVIFAFLAYYEMPFHWYFLWQVPALIVVQFAIAYAINLLIASLNLFFRDLERILLLFMTFMFYMTPVVYSADLIPEQYKPFIIFHPFAPLIINWRNVLMGTGMDWTYFGSSLLWAVGLVVFCQTVYGRLQWRFAEVL